MLNKMKRRPFFYDVAIEGDTLYFPMALYNALCKGSLADEQVEILNTFPETDTYEYCAYKGIYKFADYLLMCPRDNRDYLLYDIQHAKYLKLVNSRKHAFCNKVVFRNNDRLYIVSRETAEIDRIDLKDFSIKNITHKECVKDNAQVTSLESVENLIYIPQNHSRVICIFNMDTEEFKYIDFPENILHILTINYYNKKFWITGKDKKIYAWKEGEVRAEKIADFPINISLFYEGEVWFGNSFIYEDILWLFPVYADSILKYNIAKNCFEKFEITGEEESADQLEEELKNGRCFASKYGIVRKQADKVFFLSSKTRIFYELDLKNNDIHRHDLKVRHINGGRIYPSIDGIVQERRHPDGLDWLLERWEKDTQNIAVQEARTVGKKIYDHMINPPV